MALDINQAIVTFILEARDRLEEFEQSLLYLDDHSLQNSSQEAQTQAVDAIFRAVHTVKGSAGLFGFTTIVELTHAAETLLDNMRRFNTPISSEILDHLLQGKDVIADLIDVIESNSEPEPSLLERSTQLIKRYEQDNLSYCHQTQSSVVSAKELQAEPSPIEKRTSDGLTKTLSQTLDWHISFYPYSNVLENGLDPLSVLSSLSQVGEIICLEMVPDQNINFTAFSPLCCYLGFEICLRSDASESEINDVFEFVAVDALINLIPPNSLLERYVSHLSDSDIIHGLEGGLELGSRANALITVGSLTLAELTLAMEAKRACLADKESQDTAQNSSSQASEPKTTTISLASRHQPEDATASTKHVANASLDLLHSQTLRVAANKLDHLIDLVGEMVITGARTNLLARNSGDENLIEAMSQLERLVESVRDSSLKLRMVPIGDTFNKFRRLVRDTSLELNKQVNLIIKGTDTELDKTFIERINEPLTHIVRNAIDHGFEDSERRLSIGKSEQGTLTLNSYHDAGSIVVEVQDDGQGLDIERIKRQAIARGLISEQSIISDEEVQMLLFEPGFSTKEEVTEISGRGVGLDVVKKNVESLRGVIEVESEAGVGTCIRFRLPLTLSIIDGFMFEVNNVCYVLPLETIVECLELHEVASEADIRHKDYIYLRGEILPFVRLRRLFGQQENRAHKLESLVIVQFGALKAGIVVDTLVGEFQTVVKPLGRIFEGIKCVSGATILGSGEVAVILDVSALIHSAIAEYEKAQQISITE